MEVLEVFTEVVMYNKLETPKALHAGTRLLPSGFCMRAARKGVPGVSLANVPHLMPVSNHDQTFPFELECRQPALRRSR